MYFPLHPLHRLHTGSGAAAFGVKIERAEKERQKMVFALTTHAFHLFQESGFQEIGIQQLPQEKRKDYDYEGSKVYGRLLEEGLMLHKP